MARVSVNINNQSYEIACEDGQQESVLALASTVDEKISKLVASLGHVGEARLLVMAALLMADETQGLKKDLTRIRAETDSRIAEVEEKANQQARMDQAQTQTMTLKTLGQAAKRMESIAERIKAS